MTSEQELERTTDRSVVMSWIVLVVLLAGLVALLDWTFVHVVGRAAPSTVLVDSSDASSEGAGVADGDDAFVASPAGSDVESVVAFVPADVEVAAAAAERVGGTGGEVVGDAGEEIEASDANADATTARSSADDGLDALRRLLAEATDVTAATATGAADGRATAGEEGPPRAAAALPADLSDDVRFAYRDAALGPGASNALDELASVLAARPDVPVSVVVTANEHGDATRDRVLGRERARTIIAALVDRGIAFERLSVDARRDDALPSGSYRVRIVAGADM